jgi:cell division protein FtsB
MDRRTRIRWDRLGRWALLGVFALVLALYVGPAARWVSTYRAAKQKRAEVAQLRAENTSLRSQQARLEGAASLERQARRLGMVRAGEKLYVISGTGAR